MQVVSQLEIQLQKERDRLQSMMQHLYLSKQALPDTMQSDDRSPNALQNDLPSATNNINSSITSSPAASSVTSNNLLMENPHSISHHQQNSPKNIKSEYHINGKMGSNQYMQQHSMHSPTISVANSMAANMSLERSPGILNSPSVPIRRRITDKSALSLAGGKSFQQMKNRKKK